MIKVTPRPHGTGVRVQTILSSSMFNIKTSEIEFAHPGANSHGRTANAQTSSVPTPARLSSAAAYSYLFQVLLRLFFDLMLVHLQKVLFTADKAHRASHPSEARAHRSQPIQTLGSPRARSSSSAARIWWLNSAHMGRQTRGLASPRRQTDLGKTFARRCVRQTRRGGFSPRRGAAGTAALWEVTKAKSWIRKRAGKNTTHSSDCCWWQ